jgi:hypothetical protein
MPMSLFTTERTSLNLQDYNNYGDSPSTPNTAFQYSENTSKYQVTSTEVAYYLCLEPFDSNASLNLNYADLGELLEHFNSLPAHVQQKVSAITDKQRTKPREFMYDGYYPQTTLISMLEDTVATSVCLCGFKPGSARRSPGLCHKPRLCWKCASLEARKSLDVFKPNFHNHSWGFLTVSFHGDLSYSTTGSASEWCRYWDASTKGVRELRKDRHLDGAIIREEMKFNSIDPIRVLPHIHAIIPQGELSEVAIQELTDFIQSYEDADGGTIDLQPSIRFKPLLTEVDFEKVWFYIYKPTLFFSAYYARWNDLASPEVKQRINRSAREAIEAAINIPFQRRQIHYLGNMRSAQHDSFIGVAASN